MLQPDCRTATWTFVLDEASRILVADDDPILREFAGVYLATPTTKIDTAADGLEARTLLSQNSYDVLLLDIEMPNLDGFSLLREIRTDDRMKLLPVIMLTGHDDIASIDQAYNLGANLFATKPVNWRQLSYLIRYVLRTSRLEPLRKHSHECYMPTNIKDRAIAPAIEQEVRALFSTIIDRVDAIEKQLPADDCAQYIGPLRTIQRLATKISVECFGQPLRVATNDTSQTQVADGMSRHVDDRTLTDGMSANVVEIQ
jgi:two-component system, sensor histidine kinase and response regulator